jgi:hypothetical protein
MSARNTLSPSWRPTVAVSRDRWCHPLGDVQRRATGRTLHKHLWGVLSRPRSVKARLK